MDAPTAARNGTCRPKGRSPFSFGGERKGCKRKPAARRLRRRPTSLCAWASARCAHPWRRRAPRRSLCSHPTLPAGRFGLRPRPRWGHASLRDSSLRSPAEKALYCPFLKEGVRNVAHRPVSEPAHTFVRARSSPFSAAKMGGPCSLRCLSPSSSPQLA